MNLELVHIYIIVCGMQLCDCFFSVKYIKQNQEEEVWGSSIINSVLALHFTLSYNSKKLHHVIFVFHHKACKHALVERKRNSNLKMTINNKFNMYRVMNNRLTINNKE